jgi:hypothetical protein
MLHVLHLDVSKVDRVLHLPPRFSAPCLGVSSSYQFRLGIRCSIPLFLHASDIRSGAGPAWTQEMASGTDASGRLRQ